MAKSSRLRVADVLAVSRLAGECGDLADDPVAWRQHLLAGLARLTGSRLAVDYDGDWPAFRVAVTVSGGDSGLDGAATGRLHAEFARRGVGINPMVAAYAAAQRRSNGVPLTRADLLPDAEWYRSAYYRDWHAPTGADGLLYCWFARSSGDATGLVLVRGPREPDYTGRQRALVGLAARLVAPQVGGRLAGFADPSPAALPPRARQVLRCLLEGDSDKQVAARLGLSRLTVNQYTKHLYRHFRVQSRSELLARWLKRGWPIGPWADADGLGATP